MRPVNMIIILPFIVQIRNYNADLYNTFEINSKWKAPLYSDTGSKDLQPELKSFIPPLHSNGVISCNGKPSLALSAVAGCFGAVSKVHLQPSEVVLKLLFIIVGLSNKKDMGSPFTEVKGQLFHGINLGRPRRLTRKFILSIGLKRRCISFTSPEARFTYLRVISSEVCPRSSAG
jgi:hypothetical protein